MNAFSLRRLLAFSSSCVFTLAAFAQTEWKVRNPSPTDALVSQVAFGAGTFVGVGASGTIVSSTDGVTWNELPRFAGRPTFSQVMFGGAQFVALDSVGVSYTSPTGAIWTKRTSTGGPGPIAYGNGIYLTTSTGNLFSSSTDASTWTQRTSGTTLTGTAIAFGANVFAVATGTKIYLTTPDAITWTARSFPSGANVLKIVFANSKFVALLSDGTTAQSADAITWQLPTTPVKVDQLGSANGHFYAVRTTDSQIVTSTDGLAWTATSSRSFDTGYLATLTFGNGTYVSLGQSYYYPLTTYANVPYTTFFSSTDADTWTLRSSVLIPPASVTYGLGMFVAGEYISSDGVNWSHGGFGLTLPLNDYYYYYYYDRSYRYEFVGDRFFAFQQNYPYRVFTSTDGVTSSLALSLNGTGMGVAYGAGKYVVTGNYGSVMVSSDATTWTSQVTTDYLTDIVFANGRFVGATALNKVLTSSDAVTWTAQTLPAVGGSSSARLAYGNSKFVAVRDNGETFTSSDGISWTAQATLTFQPYSIAFANGTFVIGSQDGLVYSSSDALNWTARDGRSSSPITKFAFGNGQWVGVARSTGTVIQSDSTSGAALAPTIVLAPRDVSAVGSDTPSTTLVVAATGSGPFTYQWFQDGATIYNATGQALTISLPSVTGAVSHQYRVAVTGPGGSTTSPSATVTNLPPQPPTITAEPADFKAPSHDAVSFTVGATGSGPLTYQWRKDGQPLAASAHHLFVDAKGPSLYLYNLAPIDEGLYDVVVTGRAGSVTSRKARLTLAQSRLINLSARANVGTGENALFAGFVLANDNAAPTAANWNVIARAAGPALQKLGVSQFLGNPSVDLYQVINGQQVLQANNDNWGAQPPAVLAFYTQLSAAVGAFDFATDSLDAGLLRQGYQLNNTTPQVYSAVVRGAPGESGVALVEFYDASSVHARLLNLSARARVGSGENVLIAGFVITGTQPLKVLLRGVGPSLAGQGVTAFLKDPKLTLYNSKGEILQTNDTWGQNAKLAELTAASTAVGAFPLTAASADAALLLSLDPGAYSVQISSVDGTTGIALAEIYEVK